MNNYLFKKIEQAHSAYFENLIFVANEVCRERQSDVFEEFTQLDPKEIAEVLDWNTKESTLKMIEDSIEEKDFAVTLLRNDKTGFIAECYMPEHTNFSFRKGKERPTSWQVSPGICRIFWLYADSIGELVHKLKEKTEEFYIEEYTAEREKLSS